ncbi:fructose-bisphosphate aldolase class II/tagatose 1,6-diphosphate aldolase GatY/KbaY [Kribbella sp. VKM Ac-2527]|uniref:Fructose-bisphosphate aldolase class II/tagatose 1,6-diphosphate aldolase GatY/KbaY n=1 Tax=Kribbella caucasensis TaxID=2512215 RepID=A0A4R6JKT2_9ACTN|nr:class II fructose-bisphosphate aldolase [Kribbella sp. VKM Ac-2527]TDO35861.1 fructose-bisphosphate aldolase class II/tagatose 1,6-diphosphate aldolase GatY/KbaY [Kribbella sp. VKM Ac-2527]
MLARGTDLLKYEQAAGTAVAAFTVYTLESIRAVVDAAEATARPVLMSSGSSSYRVTGAPELAAAALAAAERASVPIGVHLDHCTDETEIARAIRLGYTSVMFDGSALPYAENLERTKAVVALAHAEGVWVEGELGALPGDEDASTDASAVELTDPAQAADFAARTGVDALAVAVGTVHGFSATPMYVDLPRLAAIAACTEIPLVLHGASGLPDANLAAAVRTGIAKVNVNAELRKAHREAMEHALAEQGDDLLRIQRAAVAAMTITAAEKIGVLSGKEN